MTERGFDTGFWTGGFVQKLPKDGKLLLTYLKTNEHCNPAGVYHITLTTISFETKIPEPELPGLLVTLAPTVGWYPDDELIWVKDFIKEQTKSPKFLAAAAKALVNVANTGLIKQVISYNKEKYMISIPYQYYMDRVSILTRVSVSSAGADSDKKMGVVKGEEEPVTNEAKELFALWNSLGVIKHKKLTGDMTRAIKVVSRDFSAAEISQAMKNYAHIVNDEQCYFKYRWTLRDFLKRGLEKFLNLDVALSNYRKGGADGADKKQPGQAGPLTEGKRVRDVRGPLR